MDNNEITNSNNKRSKSRNNNNSSPKNQNQNISKNISTCSKRRTVLSAVPNKSFSRYDPNFNIKDERLLTMNDLQKMRLESELKLLNMKHEKELFRIAQYGLSNNIFSILKTEPNKNIKNSLNYENNNYIENFNLIEKVKREQLYEIFQQKKKKRYENFQNYKRDEAISMEKKKLNKIERTEKNLLRNSYGILLRRNKILSDIERKDAEIIDVLNDNKIKFANKIYENLNEEKNKKIYINSIMKDKEKKLEKKIQKMNLKEKEFNQRENEIQWLKYGFKNYKEEVLDMINNERKEKIVKLEKLIKNEGNCNKDEFGDNDEIKKLFEEYDSVKHKVLNNNKNNGNINSNSNINGNANNKYVKNQKLEKNQKIFNNNKKNKNDNLIPFKDDLPKVNNTQENDEEEEENEKKMLTKEAIKRRVKKKRKEEYKKFMKIVDQEKKKEEKRKKEIDNTKNENEKSKLEDKYDKERTFVSIRLKNEKEKIDAEIQRYQERLAEEYLNMTGIKINIDSSY